MTHAPKQLSIAKFSGRVLLQFALLLLAFWFLLPAAWETQTSAGALTLIIVTVTMILINCPLEWVFHRWVLHTILFRWMAPPALKHRNHHRLTRIHLSSGGQGKVVRNRYPILEAEQYENAMFPWWALPTFWAVFTPILVALQLVAPRAPIFLAGYTAVTWTVWLYEVIHHIEHLPSPWWEKMFEQRIFGGFWKKAYGFHLMHHANVACNEAVAGFFGLPLADWLFGTYCQPPAELFLDGQTATSECFVIPPPRRFIQRIDHWVRQREKRLKIVAQ